MKVWTYTIIDRNLIADDEDAVLDLMPLVAWRSMDDAIRALTRDLEGVYGTVPALSAIEWQEVNDDSFVASIHLLEQEVGLTIQVAAIVVE